MRAAIIGISGPTLTDAEGTLLRRLPPAGVILFARNIANPTQLHALVASLREVLSPEAVLMIDQEGGRVARLRPPHWSAHPAAATLGRLFASNRGAGLRASRLSGALIGFECHSMGFDVVSAPVLDLGLPGRNAVIGDRAFASDPAAVGRLGRAFASGLLAAGIQPVMKHIPGHGRAMRDSHTSLPRVTSEALDDDIAPFAANSLLPWAMTAHILFPAWDAERPATVSPVVIRRIIRQKVGFEGVLVTDDLAMHALAGRAEERAIAALGAGCDLALYCTGVKAENESVLAAVGEVGPDTLRRLRDARAMAATHRARLEFAALRDERDRLLQP